MFPRKDEGPQTRELRAVGTNEWLASIDITNNAAIAGDWWTSFSRLEQSSSACKLPAHRVVANPEDADIILFSDSPSNSQADVRNHPLTRRFGEKVFVYSTNDADVPLVPGVYTSTELRWYLPSHMRSGFYIKVIDHDWIQPSPIKEKPLYLLSFCGSFDTHPSRKQNRQAGGHQQIHQRYVKRRGTRVRKEC